MHIRIIDKLRANPTIWKLNVTSTATQKTIQRSTSKFAGNFALPPPNLEILQQPNSAPPSHSHPRNFPGHAWSLSQLVTTSAQFFPPQNLTLIPEAFPSRISWSHGLPRWALTSSTSPHCVSAGRDCLQAVLLGPGRSRCRLRYCSLRLAYPLPLRPDRRKRRVEFFGILHPYWWYRTSVSGNGANQDRTGRVSPGIFGRCHGCSPILASTV